MTRPRPCDRLILSLSQAKGTVLAAITWHRHNPRRQERTYYYCPVCNGWHTSSQEDDLPRTS
jgi:hypothetical protein